jgi:DNA gyrase/topoisomerase IV subunit A
MKLKSKDLVVITKFGYVIRVSEKDIPRQHRGGQGIRIILLHKDDMVVSVHKIYSDSL